MTSGREIVALGDVTADCRYGYTASAVDESDGPKLLRITDFASGGRIDWPSVPHCEIDPGSIAKYQVEDGDVVVARTGPVGAALFIRNPPLAVFASYLVRFRFDLDRCHPRFMGFLLRSSQWVEYVEAARTGSVQPHLNATLMRRFEFALPSPEEQQHIAHILGALDDKIELNHKMNETLEAMARALFKSWFVDFDPVRAKAEGRDTGLPTHIAGLFPDSFEDSELGEIPEGWCVKQVEELAAVVGGSTPSTKEPSYWVGGTHSFATPKDLSQIATPVLLETERRITDAGVERVGSGLLPTGTVLLSSRAPIGYLAVAEVPVVVNQGFIAMRAKPKVSNLFLLLWAKTAHEEIRSRANGSTFLEISKSAFRPIPVVSPTDNVMRQFDGIARPVYARMVANACQSRVLVGVRNAILPQLISGELRVKDAERIVRAAA